MAKRQKSPKKVDTVTCRVSGFIENVDSKEVFAKLELTKHNSDQIEEVIPRSQLTSPGPLRELLSRRGVEYDDGVLNILMLGHSMSEAEVQYVVQHPGWREGAQYMWPGRIVPIAGRALHYRPLDATDYMHRFLAEKGDLEAWKTEVCGALSDSSFGVFLLGVVFAGPLLRFSGATEGALFCLAGSSGAGKTGVTAAALSCMGDAERSKMLSWNATRAGLEDIFESVRDATVIIDDTSRDGLSNRERLALCQDIGHMLAGGGARKRGKSWEVQYGAGAPRSAALGITSGELSTTELAALQGVVVPGGAQVRFIEIPVPSPNDGGVFDVTAVRVTTGPISTETVACARALEAAVENSYGVAYRAYVTFLEANFDALAGWVASYEGKFLEQVADGASESETATAQRIATKFGLVYAGLMVAIRACIIPYKKADVLRAVKVCFNAAMRLDADRARQRTRRVTALKALLRDNERVPLVGTKPCPATAVGFRRKSRGKVRAYIKGENLCRALDLDDKAQKELLDDVVRVGGLVTRAGDRTIPVKIEGAQVRHYAFLRSFFGAKKQKSKRPSAPKSGKVVASKAKRNAKPASDSKRRPKPREKTSNRSE